MSDKALSNAALELTQRIQLHFPRDINPDTLRFWNSSSKEMLDILMARIAAAVNQIPDTPIATAIGALFDLVGTVEFPGTTAPFAAKKHFVENTGEDAPVKIYRIGGRCKEWFSGKTEEAMSGSVLCANRLRRSATDLEIIAELGGEEKATTTLTELHFLLKKQGNGERGLLRTDGYANIFEIRDVDGVLRSVRASFDARRGWRVVADPVENPDRWLDGRRVLSRNS